jgi:hypothetical protein
MKLGRDMIRDELHRQSLNRWQWRKRRLRRVMNLVFFWRK